MITQNKQHHEMRKSAIKSCEMDTSHLDEKEVENAQYDSKHWQESEHDIHREKNQTHVKDWQFHNKNDSSNAKHSIDYLNDAGPDSTLDTDGKMTDAKKDNHPRMCHTIHSNASADGFYDDNTDPLAGFDSRDGAGNPLLLLDKEHRATYYYIAESDVYDEISKLAPEQMDEIHAHHLALNHARDVLPFEKNTDYFFGRYFILEKINH